MSDEIKHGNSAGQGSYERQDLKASSILYFLFGLGVATLLCIFALRGIYALLEHREKALQPSVSPLITNVPADTRHVVGGYPQSVFPDPKLEEDERGQLDEIRINEEKTLYSYGWVDEKVGTVHIPIERAMELLVQRGLPVRAQGTSGGAVPVASHTVAAKAEASEKGKKQ
jgi:hypothetical protein